MPLRSASPSHRPLFRLTTGEYYAIGPVSWSVRMSPLVRISLVLGFYTIFFSLLALAYGNEVGYTSLILGLVTVAGSIIYAVREADSERRDLGRRWG
ncbi:MAG: hypothetical protein ACP5IE_05535 [Infirmifilum sp.]